MARLWSRHGLTWHRLAGRIWSAIQNDNVFGRAAELSFYFLLALFPLLLFLTTLFGYFAQSADLWSDLLDYFRRVVPGSAFRLVVRTLDEIRGGAGGGKLSIGIVGTLWAASTGLAAMAEGINTAYDAEESRPWWKVRLIGVILTIAFAVFTLVALFLLVAGSRAGVLLAGYLGLQDAFTLAWQIGRWPVGLVVLLLAMSLLYRFAPNQKARRWGWVTPGAVVAVLVWVLSSLGFRFYLRYFNSYRATYGSLGAVIILMLWFYITGAAILIGAEVDSEIERAAVESGWTPAHDVKGRLSRLLHAFKRRSRE
jgi:membrane protein